MNKIELKKKDVTVRVIKYISTNLEKNLSLVFLADNVAYMSPCHFHRMFTKQTGVSLGQFIMLQRMKAAGKLLESSRYSIDEVAQQCGFNSCSVFYRNFRKYYNTSPDVFRKKKIDLNVI